MSYITKTALYEDTMIHKCVVNLQHVSAFFGHLYVCDITDHYCIFLYWIPRWRWPKEDETCRRFFTCFYIILSNYNAFVGVCMCVCVYMMACLTVRNMDNFKAVHLCPYVIPFWPLVWFCKKVYCKSVPYTFLTVTWLLEVKYGIEWKLKKR